MIDAYLVFRFVNLSKNVAMANGNQLTLGKCHERRLIPLAFFALSRENELQYHYVNVRNDSGDDVATSCKNLVNFHRVTPELTGLICVPIYLYLAKIDIHICIRRAAVHWNADWHIRPNSGNDHLMVGF